MIIMNVMKKDALCHRLVCLLHEKPFAGVNGCVQHNNWFLGTDMGRNLLSQGKELQENGLFLLRLAASGNAALEDLGQKQQRASVDHLEIIVDSVICPMLVYGDLVFDVKTITECAKAWAKCSFKELNGHFCIVAWAGEWRAISCAVLWDMWV